MNEPAREAHHRRVLVARLALSLAAAGLSLAWWRVILRGAPRIIDATTYWLQARAISEGALTWSPPGPLTSFAGRFLLVGEHGRLGGIFPQGLPALLAVGFAVGAPWLVGCALAVLLAWGSGSLARELSADPAAGDRAALSATALSTVCVTLRFHTAETLSHGLSAALVLASVLASTRARRPWHWTLPGLSLGALATVRPVSALAVTLVCAALALRRGGWEALSALALGLAPGVTAHLLAQHAVTGRWWTSTQTAYYAVSDGPAGCFRYGFGPRVGCRVEHGAFLARHLPHGFDAWAALGVSLRRLRAHLRDVANVTPLTLLALAPALASARDHRALRAAALATLALPLAYAPFYFDGNIEGGGARMFADVLPLEHALLGVFLARLGARYASGFVAATALAGALFAMGSQRAIVALPDHGVSRVRSEVSSGRLARGLLLVDDDRAFATLHTPGVDPRRGLVVARARHDAADAVLYARLGAPPTWRLHTSRHGETLDAWRPPTGPWRFHGATCWPPRAQSRGYARPRGDGALDLVSDGGVDLTVAVPTPWRGPWCATATFDRHVPVTVCALDHDAVTLRLQSEDVLRAVTLTPGRASRRVVADRPGRPFLPRD